MFIKDKKYISSLLVMNWTWLASLLLTSISIILLSTNNYFGIFKNEITWVIQITFMIFFFFLSIFLTSIIIFIIIKIKKYCKKNDMECSVYTNWINQSQKKGLIIYLKTIDYIVFISFLLFSIFNLIILPMNFDKNAVVIIVCLFLTLINLLTNCWFFYTFYAKVNFSTIL